MTVAADEAQASTPPQRSVTFTYDPRLAPTGSHAEYAVRLLEQAVSYVGDIDVGSAVAAYLVDLDTELDPDALPEECVAGEILRLTALVESVLETAQANLRRRLEITLATTLLPRLERTAQ